MMSRMMVLDQSIVGYDDQLMMRVTHEMKGPYDEISYKLSEIYLLGNWCLFLWPAYPGTSDTIRDSLNDVFWPRHHAECHLCYVDFVVA